MGGWVITAQKFNELPSIHFCTKLLRMGGWVATEKLVLAAHPPIHESKLFWMGGWASEAQNVKKRSSAHPPTHRSGWADGQAMHKM